MEKSFFTWRKNKKGNSFTAALLSFAAVILLCAICFVGSTLAVFNASSSVNIPAIQAASYDVSVTIMSGDTELSPIDGTYTLDAGQYTVTITAIGNATTGYAILDFGQVKAYTEQIGNGNEITFTLNVNTPANLKISASWGYYTEGCDITNQSEYVFDK